MCKNLFIFCVFPRSCTVRYRYRYMSKNCLYIPRLRIIFFIIYGKHSYMGLYFLLTIAIPLGNSHAAILFLKLLKISRRGTRTPRCRSCSPWRIASSFSRRRLNSRLPVRRRKPRRTGSSPSCRRTSCDGWRQGWKKPGFFFNPALGFFFFCFFLFFWVLVFLYICPEERVFMGFLVSRILLGASRL